MQPVGTTIFAAGGFFDVQVTGADATDALTARFYYPTTLSAAAEATLQLRYWTGAAWAPVLGSGGATPDKNTTNNLDATVSGGRFSVLLDNTSTPRITELGGTVFALAAAGDTSAAGDHRRPESRRQRHGLEQLVGHGDAHGDRRCVGRGDRPRISVNGGAWKPYTTALRVTAEGVHTVQFRSRDKAGNTEAAKSLKVRIDKTPPIALALANPLLLWPANNKLIDVSVFMLNIDLLSGSNGFRLLSVTSSEPASADDMQGWSIGTADTHGQLRAESSGKGIGRIYTLTYEALDDAGNRTTTTAAVLVPRTGNLR